MDDDCYLVFRTNTWETVPTISTVNTNEIREKNLITIIGITVPCEKVVHI
jgi:hypothetical protein